MVRPSRSGNPGDCAEVASELNRRLPVRYVRMPSMDWQPESLGMCLRAGLAKSFA